MAEFNSTAIYGDLTVTGKVKMRGGEGSEIDADKLDGHHWSEIDTAVSPANILTKLKTVDGSGSGLDADLFDGKNSSNFVSSELLQGRPTGTPDVSGDQYGVSFFHMSGSSPNKPSGTDHALMTMAYSATFQTQMAADWRTNNWYVRERNDGTWGGWDKIWTSGNDGSGSLLDADKLDGLQANQFLRKDINQTFTGNLDITAEIHGHSNLRHAKYYRQYDYDDGYDSGNYIQSYVRDNTWNWAGTGNAVNFTMLINGNKVWNQGNDGHGTGLDADLLDGHHWSEIATLINTETTANSILTKLKTVDGTGSGLDADLFDGHQWSDIDTAVSASSILTKLKTVDGAGSGLDADLFDGINSTQFLRSDTNDTTTGDLTINKTNGRLIFHETVNATGNSGLDFRTGTQNMSVLHEITNTELLGTVNGQCLKLSLSGSDTGAIAGLEVQGEIYSQGNRCWTNGNDGSGSGLDADKLDGLQGSSFLRSDTDDTFARLNASPNKYWSAGDYGISMKNSDIIGANAIYFKDTAETNEGLMFLKTGGTETNVSDYTNFQVKGDGHGYISGHKIWTAGNDGAGSGLDADKLDGLSSGSFLRSDANDTMNGNITMNDHYLYFGDMEGSKAYISGRKLGGNSKGNLELGSDATITFVETDSNVEAGNISCNSKTLTMGGNITAYSDKRVKTNITSLGDITDRVAELDIYSYNRLDLKDKFEEGVIAQEVQEVFPWFVVEGSDEQKTLSVDYAKLGAVVGVNANKQIKELKKENYELKNRLEKLENALTKLGAL